MQQNLTLGDFIQLRLLTPLSCFFGHPDATATHSGTKGDAPVVARLRMEKCCQQVFGGINDCNVGIMSHDDSYVNM